MGATKARSRAVAAVCAVACTALAGGLAAGSATAAGHQQACRQQFSHNAKARAKCIKRVKHQAGCTLVSEWNGPGPLGDTKDFSVKFKWLGNPASTELETAQLEVTIHNPRIVICSAMVSWLGSTGQGEAKVAIGPHGGLSSKIVFPASSHAPVAKVYARLRASGHKASVAHRTSAVAAPHMGRCKEHNAAHANCVSGKGNAKCTLLAMYSDPGIQQGGAKEVSLGYEEVGKGRSEHHPWTLRAKVKLLNRRLTVCRLAISVTVPEPAAQGGAVIQTTPVHIGQHGGISSPATFPVIAWGPRVEVYVRSTKAHRATGAVAKASQAPPASSHTVKSYRRSRHGAKQAPKTVAQCNKTFKHNAKARKACLARVKHKVKPTACTLKTEAVEAGATDDLGDAKDFSVSFTETTAPSHESLSVVMKVTVHNPKVEICRATFTALEGSTQNLKVFPVHIGTHGGVSSALTFALPSNLADLQAQVYGRLR